MPESLAAVVTGFNEPLELRKVPLPELDEGAVLARVDVATLCGTDIHFWQADSGSQAQLPYIPGHETTSIIEEIRGERYDVMGEQLRPGDRIIATYPHCGHCYFCTVARQPTLCSNSYSFGRQSADRSPYLLGGCAEYHYYPRESDIIKVPDEVSSPLAASAACALRTIMHGFERIGTIETHERVLIQGAGPLGLYATAVARDRGASQVLVIGAPQARLDVAREWGADDTLDIDTHKDLKERREWVMERTQGRGPDIVVQCAASAANPEGLDLVRRGGRFAAIGVTGGTITLPGGQLTAKGLTILGIIGSESRHFYKGLEFLATRKREFPFEKLLTGVYTLDRITEAFQAMADFREVKPVILPRVG
jgi:L-iditol 2-dehydrogenase